MIKNRSVHKSTFLWHLRFFILYENSEKIVSMILIHLESITVYHKSKEALSWKNVMNVSNVP